MEKLFSHLLNAGSQYELPAYLKTRVRPTNIICLLVIFVLAIPFVVISLMYFPGMAVFPGAAGVIAAAVIAVNYVGGIYYARLVLPILLLVLSSLYNAYFSTSIADSIPGVYLVELSFTLIPFVIFDFREKGFLIVCTVISFLILVVFPFSWQHFDMGYDGTALREGPLAVLTIVLAVAFQLLCITGLSYINLQAENRSQLLLDEMNEKNLQIDLSRQQLEGNLMQLEKARVQETNRQWVVEGLAKLSDLMHSQLEDGELYDKLLSTLLKYMQANQGGLYLVNQEAGQVSISLRACYAYNRKKHFAQSFAPGQGLLGQTYLEGEYIYLTELPKNYINITSGLGEATPGALLIVPLKVNETTEGMLEIASFGKLLPHEIEFVLQAGESLGAFIRNNRMSEQTNGLLLQAQQQAEAMRAQEEEMRQNLEELEATQEEMRRKEARLFAQSYAIDMTLIAVEIDMAGNMLYANENFLRSMGYTAAEMQGKKHSDLVDAATKKSDAYKQFWQGLREGLVQQGEFKRVNKHGQEVWLKGTYTPIRDENGNVHKVIKLCMDITREKTASLETTGKAPVFSGITV